VFDKPIHSQPVVVVTALVSISAVQIFEISNRIEWLLTIRFDSKLTQLFEIFEYLFNHDQPGD